MGKAIKQTILVLMIMLGLTLLPTFTTKVHASGLDAPIDTDAESTDQTTGEGLSGGPCREKTGFMCSVTYASGLNGSPTQMGHGAVLKTQGGP